MKFIHLTFITALLALPAMAADNHAQMAQDHSTMSDVTAKNRTPEVIDYFRDSNHKMHEAMSVAPSGNVDVDFAREMIAHHQGAIDMAQVHLKYSKDPELRALSEKIIKAQGPEIAQMQAWLDHHDKK